MNLIDDKGRVFGTVNIIDALAVLLVLAVVAASTAFVLGGDSRVTDVQTEGQTTVTFEVTGTQSYVADAIPNGPITSESIAAIENKSVRPFVVVVKDQNGTLREQRHPWKKTIILQLTLNTTTTEDDIVFREEPLEIGRELSLDFGHVSVTGNVTSFPDTN